MPLDDYPLPKGTAVRTRQILLADGHPPLPVDTAARIVEAAPPWYRIRTSFGANYPAPRRALRVDRPADADRLRRAHLAWQHLRPHLVLEVVVGSVAWGLADADSDLDRRGVYRIPTDWPTSLGPAPSLLRPAGEEATYESTDRLLRQTEQGDLNAFDVLGSPQILRATDLGATLRDALDDLLSRRLLHTQQRYVVRERARQLARHRRQQAAATLHATFKRGARARDALDALRSAGLAQGHDDARDLWTRLLRSLKDRGAIDHQTPEALAAWAERFPAPPVAAAPEGSVHLLRILHVATGLARTGRLTLDLRGDPLLPHLRRVKAGEVAWTVLDEEITDGLQALTRAIPRSPLPEHPSAATLQRLRRACDAEGGYDRPTTEYPP